MLYQEVLLVYFEIFTNSFIHIVLLVLLFYYQIVLFKQFQILLKAHRFGVGVCGVDAGLLVGVELSF